MFPQALFRLGYVSTSSFHVDVMFPQVFFTLMIPVMEGGWEGEGVSLALVCLLFPIKCPQHLFSDFSG